MRNRRWRPTPFTFLLAVIAIVMDVVMSHVRHIEASIVPVPVSLTDPNSDAADPDIYVFRHDD